MIKTLIIISLFTFILLFILQGRYIIKLKHHIRFKHKDLHKDLKNYYPPTLYGPLLGMGRAQINLIKNYHEQDNDPIINELSLKIKNYCISANIGVVLFIVLVVFDALY